MANQVACLWVVFQATRGAEEVEASVVVRREKRLTSIYNVLKTCGFEIKETQRAIVYIHGREP